MVCKVIGTRAKKFKAQDGTEIKGYDLYVSFDSNRVDAGQETDRLFLSENKCNEWIPKPGDEFSMEFNRYGKPDNIEVI